MKTNERSLIRITFVLALALLGAASGPILVQDVAAAGDSVCVTVQRGAFGQVMDAYIWGASPDASSDSARLYTGLAGSAEKRSLLHFDLDFLPEGAVVQSAALTLRELSTGSGAQINVYRVTEPWSEGYPTWNNFADNYDGSAQWGSFVADGPGFITVDVTGLVSAWVEGEVSN